MSTRANRLLRLAQSSKDESNSNNNNDTDTTAATTANTRTKTPKQTTTPFTSSSSLAKRRQTTTSTTTRGNITFLQPQGVGSFLSSNQPAPSSIGRKRSLSSCSSNVSSTPSTKKKTPTNVKPTPHSISNGAVSSSMPHSEDSLSALLSAEVIPSQSSIVIQTASPPSVSSQLLSPSSILSSEKEEQEGCALDYRSSHGGKTQTAEQKAKLPERWKRLEEMFWALEMATAQCSLSLRHASSLNLFPRLAERVRTVTHHNFGPVQMAQISAVYPNAYHAKRSGVTAVDYSSSSSAGVTPGDASLGDVFLEMKDHSELLVRNINLCLEKRRVAFRAALLARVEAAHRDFLRTKENNSTGSNTNKRKGRQTKGRKGKNVEESEPSGAETKRYEWHKDFPLDEVGDIEEVIFVEEPSSPLSTTTKQLAVIKKSAVSIEGSKSEVVPTMEALVARVREREELLAESTANITRKKQVNGLLNLVEMTRGFYCAEKKSVMHLHSIAAKLVASANTSCTHQGGSEVLSSVEEVKRLLSKLAELCPEWCSVIDIEGASYLKVNVKTDLILTKKRLLQTLSSTSTSTSTITTTTTQQQ